MTLGFSLAGMAVSLAVLAPNLALVWAPPRDRPTAGATVSFPVTAIERAGQVGCLVLPPISGPHGHAGAWLVALVALVALYHGLWVRYLLTGRRTVQVFAPLGPVPIPMAVVPVPALLVAAAWLSIWPLAVAAALLPSVTSPPPREPRPRSSGSGEVGRVSERVPADATDACPHNNRHPKS